MVNQVLHMDVVKGLKKLRSESADCIILDPPYNIGKNFGNNQTKVEIQEYVDWADEWLTECKRVLKPGGVMYVYGFPEILAHLSVNLDMNQRWLVWHYTNKTVPSLNFWQRTHESILCCWKDERTFFRDQVRVPYTDTFLKNAAGKKRKSTQGRFGSKETTYTAHSGGALPRDVICSPSLAGGAGLKERFHYSPSLQQLLTSKQRKLLENDDTISHPTQKPTKVTEILLDACIESGSHATVVIPFAGTGSECFVCDQRGYTWTGFDFNEDYVNMANLLVKSGFPQKKGTKTKNKT